MTLIERLRVMTHADGITQDDFQTLTQAISRIESLQREATEREREFQREARDIAVEARWQTLEETRGGNY